MLCTSSSICVSKQDHKGEDITILVLSSRTLTSYKLFSKIRIKMYIHDLASSRVLRWKQFSACHCLLYTAQLLYYFSAQFVYFWACLLLSLLTDQLLCLFRVYCSAYLLQLSAKFVYCWACLLLSLLNAFVSSAYLLLSFWILNFLKAAFQLSRNILKQLFSAKVSCHVQFNASHPQSWCTILYDHMHRQELPFHNNYD